MSGSTKVWLGVGVCVLAGTGQITAARHLPAALSSALL